MSIESSYKQNTNSSINYTESINVLNIFDKRIENESLSLENTNNTNEEDNTFLFDSSFLGTDRLFTCKNENCNKKVILSLLFKNGKYYMEFICEDNHRDQIEISTIIHKISFILFDEASEDSNIKELKKKFYEIECKKREIEEQLNKQITLLNEHFEEFKRNFNHHIELIRLKQFFENKKIEDILKKVVNFPNLIRLNKKFSRDINLLSSYDKFMRFLSNIYNLPLMPSKIHASESDKFESIKEKLKLEEKKQDNKTLKLKELNPENNEINIFQCSINTLCNIENNKFAFGLGNGTIIIRSFNSFTNELIIDQFSNINKTVQQLFQSKINNYLISSWTDCSIRIFEIFPEEKKYKLIQEIKEHYDTKVNKCIELIKYNKLVSCGNDNKIILYKNENNIYKKEKIIQTNGCVNSIVYIEKNEEIVFSSRLLKKIQFYNLKTEEINFPIEVAVNNWYGDLLLINDDILAVGGRMDEGIYLIHLQTHEIINQLVNGRFINSLCKINDNFILSGEWSEDKNGILVIYKYEYGNIDIEDVKFKAHGNSVSSVITNGKIAISCSTAKTIRYWELIEVNENND